MIIDCFSFFNELELLEVRLNELNNIVDRFVLVESTVTHSNKPKPLYFEENRERFSKFAAKIHHLVITDMPTGADDWARENYQRNFAMHALTNCRPEDLILISDLDEIPKAKVIRQLVDLKSPHVLQQDLYYYFLNLRDGKWDGTVVCRFDNLLGESIQSLRDKRDKMPKIQDAGWHFSYLGGVERIIHKLNAYAHQEYNNSLTRNRRNLQYSIITGRDFLGRELRFELVSVSALPQTITTNLAKYDSLLAKKPDEEAGFTENWYSQEQIENLKHACKQVRFLDGAVVEIGSWEGRSAVALANSVFPQDVFAVDTWQGNLAEGPEHPSVVAAKNRDVFLKFAINVRNLTKGNVFPFMMESSDFLLTFKSPIKFCHIDAAHDYRSVHADIEGAIKLLVDGGVLCGDDFASAHIKREDLEGGVERAVRELLPGFHAKKNFWYWRKPSGFRNRTFFSYLASRCPSRLLESKLVRKWLPEPKAISAHDALQEMHATPRSTAFRLQQP